MRSKRILAALVLITFFITTYGMNTAFAAISDVPVPPAPNNLAIPDAQPDKDPPIGYNAADGGQSGYYADIQWGAISNPANKYLNIYLEESPKGYRTPVPVFQKEKDLPAGTYPIRMRNLKSGTVYKANARSYATATDPITGTIYKSAESANSNTVKFMTDINIQCVTMSTSQIKIIWDDVWNDGKRISYRLYVSENADFANTLPITISQDQISPTGPVYENQTDGTLEYTHTVKDPGRVYYVKIEPVIPDAVKTPATKTVLVSTYILAKTTKISTTDIGTIWRLDWSPVVTGLSTSNIKVEYRIYKYLNGVAYPIMVETGTTTFITVPEGESESYYIISAYVTKDGLPYYPDNIDISSEKILLKESETPATPSAPELVPQFTDSADSIIISYEDALDKDGSIKKGELGKDTATVLWRLPRKADGTVDTDVMYDIWLIDDPDQIDTPPVESQIQTSFKPGDANFVKDDTNNGSLVGYKYKLNGLEPNHSYYFKIVAKKTFAEEKDGIIQNVDHVSNPALKVITTLSGNEIDTPLIPSNPPLQIRKKEDGKTNMISDTSVTIQLKNRWYEEFDPATGQWSYVQADKTSLDDNPPYNPAVDPPGGDNPTHRKVEYGPGVTLYVGCQEYTEGMDIKSINTYKLEKVPTTPNDPTEDPTLNVPENIPIPATGSAIYAKHNVVIPVNDLKPNTTYILWVRAARDGDPTLFSDISNPIIFTTLPTPTDTIEKPVVPDLRCTNIADTFVDLAWNYKEQNTYYIKYGTEDDISKAKGSVTVTGSQIKSSGLDYVRIPGLTANTQYYFWIQAEAFNSDMSDSVKSEWSDSLPLKTLKDIPPATPRGFGVKNTTDAVTKNSITFEWIQEPGLQYILEIAGKVDYSDAKVYKAGSVSEFKVDGLTSNFRYFARLYAYDPAKKLQSNPTQSISVRTLRSSDDYDSDQDVDNPISGDIVDKAPTIVNGTWVVKIVGVNADRLVQLMMTDNQLDYTVDVSKPPASASNISLMISKKVFDKLYQLRENIAFKTAVVSYNLKAGILSNVITSDTQKEQIYTFSITLTPQKPATRANELEIRQPLAQMGVSLDTGTEIKTISQFAVPLEINYPYTNQQDYNEGLTNGYLYNSVTGSWDQKDASGRFDVDNNIGTISFRSTVPGLFALADKTDNLFEDIYGNAYESSIINVAMAHKLKSITGRMFNPDSNVTVGDAVKLVFDSLEYNYESDYMELAVKTGMIKSGKSASGILSRQDAACMVAVLYEIKTNTRVNGSKDVISSYSDYGKIDKTILNKVAFAAENGFVPNASSSEFNPTQSVTRGELMYMIEKSLVLSGDM
ncbi:MAG TPA: fibronectin type III domain-containing protein [Ruminiclostridium sp.]|nr:fibronectin type III domain-containing protein [Ruminiclostridium sp.]